MGVQWRRQANGLPWVHLQNQACPRSQQEDLARAIESPGTHHKVEKVGGVRARALLQRAQHLHHAKALHAAPVQGQHAHAAARDAGQAQRTPHQLILTWM